MFNFAIYKTDIGYIKIGYKDEFVVSISMMKKVNDFGVKTELTNRVYLQLVEYLDGLRTEFDFEYKLIGTDFQKRVWDELLKIPYANTRSYQDIALKLGNKNLARAVGMANNKNPMMIVVPCHRVIGKNGNLTGYAGGLDLKNKLLKLEQNAKLV